MQSELGTRLLTFHVTLEQRVEIAISLCKPFQTFAQLLAIPLANPRVPDSPAAEFQILACFEKTYTHENFQPYDMTDPFTCTLYLCLSFHQIADYTHPFLWAMNIGTNERDHPNSSPAHSPSSQQRSPTSSYQHQVS